MPTSQDGGQPSMDTWWLGVHMLELSLNFTSQNKLTPIYVCPAMHVHPFNANIREDVCTRVCS